MDRVEAIFGGAMLLALLGMFTGASCKGAPSPNPSVVQGIVSVGEGTCQVVSALEDGGLPPLVNLVCQLLGADGRPLAGPDGGVQTSTVTLPRAAWEARRGK